MTKSVPGPRRWATTRTWRRSWNRLATSNLPIRGPKSWPVSQPPAHGVVGRRPGGVGSGPEVLARRWRPPSCCLESCWPGFSGWPGRSPLTSPPTPPARAVGYLMHRPGRATTARVRVGPGAPPAGAERDHRPSSRRSSMRAPPCTTSRSMTEAASVWLSRWPCPHGSPRLSPSAHRRRCS